MIKYYHGAARPILLPALLLSAAAVRGVGGHALEILSCFTDAGDLRVFIRHWHTCPAPCSITILEPVTVADVGGITIDGSTVPEPDGLINDVPATSLVAPWSDLEATGCCTPVVQEKICGAGSFSGRVTDSYVWYDFPAQCGVPVTHMFEVGHTVTLFDGCEDTVPLFPATITDTFNGCSGGPTIYVDGEPCSDLDESIVVSAVVSDCAAERLPVDFELSASDDCDPSPSVTSSPPSGSLFPVGTTTVTVTSTDAQGNVSTCTFDVVVFLDPDLCPEPSASPSTSVAPTRSPVRPPEPRECLGCNFMSTVLGRPVATGGENVCSMSMGSMTIRGTSGRCYGNLFAQRECEQTQCSITVSVTIRLRRRCQCTLSIYDDADRVLYASPNPGNGEWLSFSYEARPECECHTHRIKAVFSCPGKHEDYVLTQRAEYTCSECEALPIV